VILFSFATRPLSGPGLCVDAARWVFECTREHIGFTEQRRFIEQDEWGSSGDYYWIARCGWAFGYLVAQYDGFHEVLRLGPICLTWCNSFDGTDRWWPCRRLPPSTKETP